MPVLVISSDTMTLLKIQSRTRFVRNALYESSRLFSFSSFGSWNGANARFTVDSNWLSMSACGLSISSTKFDFRSSRFVCADGSASDLSDPFVPHETSCQLQNA